MAHLRRLAIPIYLVGFSLLAIPPIDALVQALPMRFGDARWRFGAFGLMGNALMLSLIGLLIIVVTAVVLEHRRLQRVLGVASLVCAATIALALIVFGLDAIQVRQQVQPAAIYAFRVAAFEAVAKTILAAVTLATFTLALLRGRRGSREKAKRDALVVGSSGTIAPGLRPQADEQAGEESNAPTEVEIHAERKENAE